MRNSGNYRRHILGLLILLLSLVQGMQGREDERTLQWNRRSAEAELADDEVQARLRFKCTNIGQDDLRVLKATSSCGCTVTDFKAQSLAPGQSLEIVVTVSLPTSSNERLATIVVESTSGAADLHVTVKRKQSITLAPRFVYWTVNDQAIPKVIEISWDPGVVMDFQDVGINQSHFRSEIIRATPSSAQLKITPITTKTPAMQAITIKYLDQEQRIHERNAHAFTKQ
jgi:glycine cleavage system regulatory protein